MVLVEPDKEDKRLTNSFTLSFMSKNLQIEQIIQQQLQAEGRNVTWLCQKLGWQRIKWYRFCGSGLIEVHDLYNLSVLLRHDFFQYYSRLLENHSVECNKLDTDV
ncbi:hypothetical protein FACS1894199_18090 [Bacteroidia bacterium]|nr:hypothetical protein FACS1894199_18090 [Bacteroidia bacterium]